MFDGDRFQKTDVTQVSRTVRTSVKRSLVDTWNDVNQTARLQQEKKIGRDGWTGHGFHSALENNEGRRSEGGRRRGCDRVELLCSWLTGRLARRDWVQRGAEGDLCLERCDGKKERRRRRRGARSVLGSDSKER